MLLEREIVGGEGERELTRDLVACSNHFSGARVPAAARGWRGRWDNRRQGSGGLRGGSSKQEGALLIRAGCAAAVH